MIKEHFKDITIAYMRRTGEYGIGNKILMENFKAYLRAHHLLSEDSVILAIPLDNPESTEKEHLRYDVGLIVDENVKTGLPCRRVPDGAYAVFEIPHTKLDIAAFYEGIDQTISALSSDMGKPIMERYSAAKIASHLCEICVPLKE